MKIYSSFRKNLCFAIAAVVACGLAFSLNAGLASAEEDEKTERAAPRAEEAQTTPPGVGAGARAGENPGAGAKIKAPGQAPEQGCHSNVDQCNKTLANLACGGHSEDPDGDGNYTCKKE